MQEYCGFCDEGVVYDDFEGSYFPCPNCRREHLHLERLGASPGGPQEWDDFEGNTFAIARGRPEEIYVEDPRGSVRAVDRSDL